MSDEPERTCIVTRTAKPKEQLLRFVVSPDGLLVPDLENKLPGRGIYVTCSRLLVAEAIAKKAFQRAAEQPITMMPDFLNRLEEQLALRVKNALSLARKAGAVVSGFEKVEKVAKNGEAIALMHSYGAGGDSVKKLKNAGLPTFQHLPQEWLNEVLGKENAVHVAILGGPASALFMEQARRFALFLE